MAENSRMSKLSEKDDECVFTWKLFTGWDYMIGNAETAHNRTASIILGFKEALLEEAEKKKNAREWRIIGLRVLVNFVVGALLAASAYAVVEVVKRSTEPARNENWWRQNEITMVLTMITFIYPIIFEVLGFFEGLHPRKQLRLQLGRIMLLNLLNLYTLIFALFGKISLLTKDLQSLRQNATASAAITLDSLGSSTPWPVGSPASAGLPTVSETPDMTTPSIPDVTASIVMLVTALSGASRMITNVMSEPAEVTYVVSKLVSLLNYTDSTSGLAHLPTLPTVFNWTQMLDGTTDYNYLFLKDTDILTNGPPISSETSVEFYDNLVNQTGEYFWDRNRTFGDQLTNAPVNISDIEVDSLNFTDDSLSILSSDATHYFDMTNNISISSMKNTTFDILDMDFDLDSRNLSSDQSLDNMSGTFIGNFLSTEGVPPSSSVTVANLNFDNGNMHSTSPQDSEREQLMSTLITTLATLLAQNRDFSDSSDHIKQVSEILQRVTTDFTDPTKCYSTQCNTVSTDATVSTWEPAATLNTITEKHSPGSVTVESTLNLGKSYGSSALPVRESEISTEQMDIKIRRELRRLCWETMFGQELVKLTVMDLVVTVSSTLIIDFFRAVFVRVMNNCWCWDLEKQFPQYGDFKIAENILHLVNNQGMVWMGMFFSPGLPLLNLIKLVILMYLRSWAVLTCNVPHEVVFRASRSNNFYFALLLTMLFLCVLPVGYAIVWVEPSWHCGPFSGYKHIYHIFTKSLQKALPESLHRPMDYIASPGIVIPLLLLLVLVIYYLVSLTSALREANNDLKIQLRRERTEERRKMFQLVHRRRRGGSGADGTDTAYSRWRKILPVMPSKSLPGGPAKGGDNADDKDSIMTVSNGNIKSDANRNETLARIMKKALRKSSATSDEESMPIMDGEGTDIELHDSLTEDRPHVKAAKVRPRFELYNSGIIETSFDVEQEPVTKCTAKSVSDKNYHRQHHSHRRRSEHRHKSPSSSSTNKEREDSLISTWSDNIPVIRISKTDSSECIQQRAEPQQPIKSSSSDTVILPDGIEPVHKPTKTLSSSVSPSVHQKSDTNFSTEHATQDTVKADNNGHKRLVRALITESKRRKDCEDDGFDTVEMTCRNTSQKKNLKKDETKKSQVMS